MDSVINASEKQRKEIIVDVRFGTEREYREKVLRDIVIDVDDEKSEKMFDSLCENINYAIAQTFEGEKMVRKESFTSMFTLKFGKFTRYVERQHMIYPVDGYIRYAFDILADKAENSFQKYQGEISYPIGNTAKKIKRKAIITVSFRRTSFYGDYLERVFSKSYFFPSDNDDEKTLEYMVKYVDYDILFNY